MENVYAVLLLHVIEKDITISGLKAILDAAGFDSDPELLAMVTRVYAGKDIQAFVEHASRIPLAGSLPKSVQDLRISTVNPEVPAPVPVSSPVSGVGLSILFGEPKEEDSGDDQNERRDPEMGLEQLFG